MRTGRTLVGRLVVWQASVVVAVLLGAGLVVDRVLARNLVDELAESLPREARLVRESLAGAADLQEDARRLGQAAGIRITLIRPDGVVLADSDHDPATMENHADRPEVVSALRGELGVDVRKSDTLGIEFLYVALPHRGGDFVWRVALPLTRVRAAQGTIRVPLAAGLLAAAAAALLGVLLATGAWPGPSPACGRPSTAWLGETWRPGSRGAEPRSSSPWPTR